MWYATGAFFFLELGCGMSPNAEFTSKLFVFRGIGTTLVYGYL